MNINSLITASLGAFSAFVIRSGVGCGVSRPDDSNGALSVTFIGRHRCHTRRYFVSVGLMSGTSNSAVLSGHCIVAGNGRLTVRGSLLRDLSGTLGRP